jgi:carboxyl-terminal processing protease
MVGGLDAYSRYYDREESEAIQRETDGLYVGVGIVFRRPANEGKVLFTLGHSPARKAGVRVGDRVLSIDAREMSPMSEAEVRALLSDSRRPTVQLEVIGRDGAERRLELRPDSVVDPTVRHVDMIDPELGAGYMAVSSFTHETDEEFDEAFEHLRERGMTALVLDLRRNYGGVLDSAVAIARRFIPARRGAGEILGSDLIVSTEGRGPPELYRADARACRWEGFPLVLLVDGDSASASEILAGALQDHRVAVVIGSPTYGKGMVQTIRQFHASGTMAKVTSAYYYSPTHRNFERSAEPGREYGILPDLWVVLGAEERENVHRFLSRYGPPLDLLAEVEDLERESGEVLIDRHPPDAQLEAALELLRGRLPGPHSLGEAE